MYKKMCICSYCADSRPEAQVITQKINILTLNFNTDAALVLFQHAKAHVKSGKSHFLWITRFDKMHCSMIVLNP